MTQPPATTRPSKLTDLLDPAFMARLDALDVASRKILRGKLKGERRSKRRGQSVEFADYRAYVHGDDIRFIDWNVFGRLDQLFMKLFLEEQDLSLHVLMDTSASTATGEPPKDLMIKRLAAALGYVGLVNHNRVTLSAFADGLVGQVTHMRGRNFLGRMTEFLLALEAEGESHFEKAAKQVVADRLGSGVTVVLSDLLFKEGFEQGLKRLVSDRYDLAVIQVLSPQERRPDLMGDLKLVDVEDADTSEVTVSGALLKYYDRTLAAFCNSVKDFCARRGAVYVLTDSAQPVDKLVLEQLRRRQLLV